MAFRSFEGGAMSRRGLLRSGAMLGAGMALAGIPAALRQAAWAAEVDWPGVTSAIESYVSAGKVANMVATFGQGQQPIDVIARGTLGFSDLAPANADSLYRIYSMTKPITGMATMMLIDDGVIGLDQPLAEILPAFANMQVQKTYDGSITDLEPAERPITIRMLLTHTAGLGYPIIQKGPIRDAYMAAGLIPGQVSRIPIPGVDQGKTVSSLAAFADGLAAMPLVYQPGTQWSYSVGLDLLGRVIEVAGGMALDVFLQQRLFDPLGMDSTWFRVPQGEVARLTSNYGVWHGSVLPMDPGKSSIFLDEPAFPMGGAGLVSSPRDYDRFLRMLAGYGLFDGKRVMSEAAVRTGTSNLLPDGASVAGTWVEGQGFGAGGRVSGSAFGWAGAAGTVGFVDMGSGLRGQLFTQYMPAEAYAIQRKFPELVMADLAARKGGQIHE